MIDFLDFGVLKAAIIYIIVSVVMFLVLENNIEEARLNRYWGYPSCKQVFCLDKID
jgi:hypothetical protein